MNELKTRPVESDTGGGDDVIHWWCCDPFRALCGAECDPDEEVDCDGDCVVCVDLEDGPCRPGCDW